MSAVLLIIKFHYKKADKHFKDMQKALHSFFIFKIDPKIIVRSFLIAYS